MPYFKVIILSLRHQPGLIVIEFKMDVDWLLSYLMFASTDTCLPLEPMLTPPLTDPAVLVGLYLRVP